MSIGLDLHVRCSFVACLALFTACYDQPGEDGEVPSSSEASTSSGSGSSSSSDETADPSTDPETSAAASSGSSGPGESSESSTAFDEGSSESSSTGEPATCLDGASPFDPPVAIAELNTSAHDEGPSISSDELTVYFSSSRAGGPGYFDLYAAHRADTSSPFGEPVLFGTASTPGQDRRPSVTADGLTMYAMADTGTNLGGYDIMVATRASLAAEFGELESVAGISTPLDDGTPTITGDGDELIFDVLVSGHADLHRAMRMPNGAFGEPVPMGELNLADSEDALAVLTSDGLTIFFGSTRPGGLGDYDIWTASRSTRDDGFGTVEHVPEISSPELEGVSSISVDGCRLYMFVRSNAQYDIYVAERSPM